MLAWSWTRLSDGGSQVSISGRALRRFPEREVERLLRARVLIEHSKADSWSVCAHCECGLDVRPIRKIGDELRVSVVRRSPVFQLDGWKFHGSSSSSRLWG